MFEARKLEIIVFFVQFYAVSLESFVNQSGDQTKKEGRSPLVEAGG